MTRRKQLEHDLQRSIKSILDYRLDPDKAWWFHVPNGAKLARGAAGWSVLKSLGAVAGVPDMTFLINPGRVAFIELKAGKNQLTAGQKLIRETCETLGVPFYVCRSVDEVMAACEELGILK